MLNITNFDQANKALYEFIPKGTAVTHYNLEKITKLMQNLGNPQDKVKIIHVAGTSGKTSTCYYLASLLFQAGYSVGLTVSPHIDAINERAQINLSPLPESEYCHELSQFLDIIEPMNLNPSYFEVLVAFAYWLFDKKDVQYAVVEVGLGGLLDGTNVINRADKVCVITDIGLDHTKILGETIEEIATQKAGIIQRGNDVFIYDQGEKVMNIVEKRCQQQGAILHLAQPSDKSINIFANLPIFQKRNINLAVQAVSYVLNRNDGRKLTDQEITAASSVYIPARMEVVNFHGKKFILDGSHNEQKIQALVDATKQLYGDESITLLVSFGENKRSSVVACLKLLRQLSPKIILTGFDIGQDEVRASIKPDELTIYAKEADFTDITAEPDVRSALEILEKDTATIKLVTGSFYLMNEVRPVVLDRELLS